MYPLTFMVVTKVYEQFLLWQLSQSSSLTFLCGCLLQGTAAVALAGLIAALPLTGGALADHKYLFFGAGEVIILPLQISYSISKSQLNNSFWSSCCHNYVFTTASIILIAHPLLLDFSSQSLLRGNALNGFWFLNSLVMLLLWIGWLKVCVLADKLWLSCVQAGTGIAEILALEINRQGKHTLEEARKKIYLVDSKVIIFRNIFSNSPSVVSLAH